MNLVNTVVKHKTFGIGKVIRVTGKNIIVQFDAGEKKFAYPDAFGKHLTTDDSAAEQIIDADVEAKKNELVKNKELESKRLLEEAKERQRVRLAEEEKSQATKKNRTKSYTLSKQEVRSNVAFKCNFCDGGASEENIGFKGICSYENMRRNVVGKRPWCSYYDSPCNLFLTKKISRDTLESYMEGEPEDIGVCYESRMLINWSAHAGIAHSGQKKDTPYPMKNVENNTLAVLTTRLPQKDSERNRIIFAVFLVDESYEGDYWDEGYVAGSSKYKIALRPEEAAKMLFWNYFSNDKNTSLALWGSGLFRYFNDVMAVQILKDIAEVKKGRPDEGLANEFFEHYCYVTSIDPSKIPPPAGTLVTTKVPGTEHNKIIRS